MKMINKIKNITALFFCSALIFSCTNFMNAGAKKSSAADKNAVVMFYGTIQYSSGALPEDIARLCADLNGGTERSAVPVYSFDTADDTAIQYFATARCGQIEKLGEFAGNSNIFTISLDAGKKWEITCGICEKENTSNVYMSETKTFDIKASNPVLSYTFTPKPGMTGNGKIELEFKFDNAAVNRIDYFNAFIGNTSYPGEVSGDDGSLTIDPIKSGIYDVTFKFYNNNDTPDSAYDDVMLYYTVQTIAVFDKMTTNTWVSDGNITIDGNKLSVTDAVIEAFEDNSIYVGSTNKGQAASDTNAGTVYTPFKTLQRAIDKIALTGNGKDYTIFIYGTVQGCTKIPDTIVKGTNGKASSITITGISNAVLDGNVGNTPKGDGHVLWIKSDVPVTIRDIKITGGNTIYGTVDKQGSGGGICIAPQSDDSKVVIDGCNITGNHASDGGGIYIENSKVKITNTNIKSNYADTNAAYDGGGGISIYNGAEVTLGSGCVIESNTARMGGGVGIIASKLIFDGAEIKSNKALNYSSNSTGGGWGGGIYLGTEGGAETGTKVFITRGKISGNIAEQNGGGICFKSYGAAEEVSTLSITGGTIENNKAEENGVAGEGGAIWLADPFNEDEFEFVLGGAAYIPAGTSGKNDIFFAGSSNNTYAKITLQSELSKHSKNNPIAIRIDEENAKRGIVMVQPASSLENQKDSFKLYSDDWVLGLSTDKKSLALDAPIWVAGTGAQQCMGTPGATGPGTKSHPYDTIKNACKAMTDSTVEYTVYIDGKLTVKQEISSDSMQAAKINIEGANGLYTSGDKAGEPMDSIDGSSVASDQKTYMLYISNPVDITIKNLKITGGDRSGKRNTGNVEGGGIFLCSRRTLTLSSGTLITENKARQGGGVYVKNSTLVIEDGAKITKNTATGGEGAESRGGGVYLENYSNTAPSPILKMAGGEISGNYSYKVGGGVCVYGDCYFFMYGNALIGADLPEDKIGSSDISLGCNKAESGGGVYLKGYAYFGYEDANEDGSPKTPHKLEKGVIGNYAASSYNASSTDYHGGGVSLERGTDGKPIMYMSSGLIAKNTANVGGAIYYEPRTSTYCKLTIGGDASIPALDGEGKNDIYLADVNKSMSFANSLTKHDSTNPITISLSSSWSQGNTVVATDPARVLTDDDLKCFKLSSEREAAGMELKFADDKQSIKLEKPIYVKQGGTPSGSGTADGTKTKPYGSIEAACAAMTSNSIDYVIKIIGNDTPLQGAQNIPASGFNAKSITIMGANGLYTEGVQAGQPKDAIYGMGCDAPVLTINKDIDVTIKELMITGAAHTSATQGAGGGIRCSNTSFTKTLTLSKGAYITGNTAKVGGGVHKQGGALVIEDGAVISGNTADSLNDSNAAGGGLFISMSTLYMSGGKIAGNEAKNSNGNAGVGGGIRSLSSKLFIYGSAVIGGVAATNPSCPSSADNAKAAGGNVADKQGAGINASGTSMVCLGYTGLDGDNPVEATGDKKLVGGVLGNYSSNSGGGVYLENNSSAKLYIASGNVSYNYAYVDGGGVYSNNALFELSDGALQGNKVGSSGHGGGVYNAGTFNMKGGEISGGYAKAGGGVHSGKTFDMSGGKIYGNSASNHGGGVWLEGTDSKFTMNGSAVIGGDSEKLNTSYDGGGLTVAAGAKAYIGYKSNTTEVDSNFSGGFSYNRATNGYGGAIELLYDTNNPVCKIAGGYIINNTGKGSGIMVSAVSSTNSSQLEIQGCTYLAPDNVIFLQEYTSVKITGALTPTDTGASGGTLTYCTATITPTDYDSAILTAGDGVNLEDWVSYFAITPKPGTPAMPDGLGYGAGADGKYSTDRFLVSSSSDEVLTAMNDLIKNSTKENPVNLCFTTDFAPSSYVASGNDTNFTDTASIIRVMSGKSVNITATKPITIKNTFGGGAGCIVYCENGYLTIDENITIEQNNSNSSEYGVRINGGEATLNGCEIKNSKGRGLYVWSGIYSGYGWHCPSAKVTVNAGTKIHDCGDSGIFVLQDTSTLFLNGGEVYNCKGSGIWLTTYGRVVCPNNSAVSIHDNTYNNSACQVYFYNNSGGKWGTAESNLQEYTKNLKWTTFPPS